MDIVRVDEASALRLRKDEVEEEEKANVRVEGDPDGTNFIRERSQKSGGLVGVVIGTYQTRNHSVQLSTRRAQARTTQYISHGVSWAGSEVLRAL